MIKSESGKSEVVYCRVNQTLKKRLETEVKERGGEAEAVIVRDALREYFDRRDHPEKYPPYQGGAHSQFNERPAAPGSADLPVGSRSQNAPAPPRSQPSTTDYQLPQDIAAEKLGQRAVNDLPDAPAKPAPPRIEESESETDRKARKAVGKLKRDLARQTPEKHGK